MKIIIDTNVLMAGLIKDSTVRAILLTKDIKFFLPEFAIGEIRKYEPDLLKKSGYTKKEFKTMMNLLLEKIRIIPKSNISEFMIKAERIMSNIDIKDSSFIASALSINADGIWTFDKHFQQQKIIKVFNIEDLLPLR